MPVQCCANNLSIISKIKLCSNRKKINTILLKLLRQVSRFIKVVEADSDVAFMLAWLRDLLAPDRIDYS